ncbi:uncharacterized protein LOC129569043 [Sitodiplosis mosellana]|uniref:uncharacterized protein LOC129569043 n=1 Tax=Sitodiplosis mosellana TaxID=263140 RepID=UPI002443BFF0|nr:uncharacterized protein LOC129569043 [Sitodiplosis mosellana]
MVCSILLSFLIFPASIAIATQNIYYATGVTLIWICVVIWTEEICKRFKLHSKYFSVCALSAVISFWILLQYSTLQQIRAANTKKIELYLFNVSMLAGLLFFYMTRRKAAKYADIRRELENSPEYSLLMTDSNKDETEKSNTSENDQSDDQTENPFPKWHQRHTSIWLNCIINGQNLKYYLLGIILTSFGLLSGINLSVTTICRNIEIFRIFKVSILAPYSCCGAFNHFQSATIFLGCYLASAMAVCCLLTFIMELYLLLKHRFTSKSY